MIASRYSGVRAQHRGTLVLIEGCALRIIGLAVLVAAVACAVTPSATLLSVVLIVFGYGQGLVMAPLSSAVLASVKPASAGSGLGDVRHHGADRQCLRRCRDRRGIFRDRSRIRGEAGAVHFCVTVCTRDCYLSRISVMDASRVCLMPN